MKRLLGAYAFLLAGVVFFLVCCYAARTPLDPFLTAP